LYEVCNHHFQNIFHGLVQTQMHNQTDTLLHTCHNYIQQQIERTKADGKILRWHFFNFIVGTDCKAELSVYFYFQFYFQNVKY
jgi:hypothetical protein